MLPAESDDEVSLIRFNGETETAEIERTTEVGVFPAENEGPHGLAISPDGEYWFVSIAHGMPYGQLWKYKTGTDEFMGKVDLGLFPATMDISTATGLIYIVNFNLHGDMIPSTVSVVDPVSMIRVADIETGIMPHGSRVDSEGRYQYHVSMMTDELIEINTVSMEVERKLHLVEGSDKMKMDSKKMDHSKMDHHSAHGSNDKDMGMDMKMHKPKVKPTWADPHPSKPLVYVAGNGNDEVIEIDTDKWEVTRRFKTGKAPYNLEVTHDGNLLVVTYKGEAKTALWDLKTGKELKRIDMSRRITHGIAISTDNKYAFISVEGIGGEPGSVDILNLEKKERVAVVETGKQAGGISFWKQN